MAFTPENQILGGVFKMLTGRELRKFRDGLLSRGPGPDKIAGFSDIFIDPRIVLSNAQVGSSRVPLGTVAILTNSKGVPFCVFSICRSEKSSVIGSRLR